MTSLLKISYVFRNSSSSAMRWSRSTSSSSVNIRISQLYSNVVQRVTDESAIIVNMEKNTNESSFFFL